MTPNYKRMQNILSDALAYRDNRRYDPKDPIIVSEGEVYCSAECYAVSFIREEEHEGQEQQSQWHFLSWYGNGKKMGEELTTEELMDLRVILTRFMADKEAHKKIPRLESRAPKLWDKVDRMY